MGTKKTTPPKKRVTPAGTATTPSPAAAARAAKAATNGRPAEWGVLVYLAGDIAWGHQEIQQDLEEILKARASADLRIVVQHDGPEGAARYIVPSKGSRRIAPIKLDRVDSGGTTALLEFLRWGMSVCHAERLALVLGSPLAVSPGDVERPDQPDRATVFSLTYDQGSGNCLDIADLAGVIRDALDDAERDRLDLLAIDSCRVQYIELAYELETTVRTLIAPQTVIPMRGWDYVRVLGRWKALAAKKLTTRETARALVDEIIECYRDGHEDRAISALDLERLDDVARAFDTMCIGTLQALGEGLIWEARSVLLQRFANPTDRPVYDCGSFFALWSASLRVEADEAYQRWLGKTLTRAAGSAMERFCEAVARQLDANANGRVDARRLRLILDALRRPGRHKAAGRLLKEIHAGVMARLEMDAPNHDAAARTAQGERARTRDKAVQDAIEHAFHLLPAERQYDLKRLAESVVTAHRLADQSMEAVETILGHPEQPEAGMVIAVRSTSDTADGWPRWSGASLYRPRRLDDLMNTSYQRFAFHRRVHWAAMLGAANLIEEHPRALWRLVSSLLSTGSAVTRRDVLHRLTGSDSVVWGLREQFRVMAPAPTITLSLERRTTPPTAAQATQAAAARAVDGASNGNGDGTRENYLLRLESIVRGAVVTEQESRVQPKVMDQALEELNALLQRETMTTRALNELRSIGGLLGEDIFQSLGRILDEERKAVRAETPDVTPHLQLQIPRELMKYPWELLHHHREWLGERYAMGRQVYMETGLARRVPQRRQGRVRPLIIGDPVFDPKLEWRQLPGARAEAEQVAGYFESLCQEVGGIIDFDRERDTRIHTRLTRADLRALLREGQYDIVHFAGHGVFRADDPETSAWLLSDGELWSLEIRNTLAEQAAPPWLVFANACEAGMDAARPERKYQGNVFGLATAFINQGVAAYIAPLWPIDDLLAQHISLKFYQQLLCERATLGESLRRAKASARRLAYAELETGPQDPERAWAGLGWASLVLYGDPTEELFQALAGGVAEKADGESAAAGVTARSSEADIDRGAAGVRTQSGARPTSGARPAPPARVPFATMIHAPDRVVSQWVKGPNWTSALPAQRGAPVNGGNGAGGAAAAGAPVSDGAPVANAANGDVTLELIEDAGLRRWRVRQPDGNGAAGTRGAGAAGDDALPGSQLAALLAHEGVRGLLPARRGVVRVIGRWVLSGFKNGVRGLVETYDKDQVKKEGLLIVNGTSSQQLVSASREAAAPKGTGQANRALVLIHGTFSKTASPVDGFGPKFIQWARDRYRVVLGLDHWTLSKSPEDNAKLLANELRALAPDLLKGRSLDIIAHSRGGLVARAFCDLEGHADAVRHLIFLGTPNCGTDLANPKNWGSLADLLVNMTGVDGAELYGRMAGLLAQLAVYKVVSDVPGLLAQSPDTVDDTGSVLNRLLTASVDRAKVRYGVVCSEFEPTALVPNVMKLVAAAKDAGVDLAMDTLFGSANDLVVNTTYAWGIGVKRTELAKLPAWVASDRVLLLGPPKMTLTPPADVVRETALGVHHTNLFSQARVQDSIKTWLSEA